MQHNNKDNNDNDDSDSSIEVDNYEMAKMLRNWSRKTWCEFLEKYGYDDPNAECRYPIEYYYSSEDSEVEDDDMLYEPFYSCCSRAYWKLEDERSEQIKRDFEAVYERIEWTAEMEKDLTEWYEKHQQERKEWEEIHYDEGNELSIEGRLKSLAAEGGCLGLYEARYGPI